MEPKFVSKPAFTAVGLEYYGKNQNQEIAQLWQQFNPKIREIVKLYRWRIRFVPAD